MLRTFEDLRNGSLRLGLNMARPDLHVRMMHSDGQMQSGALPVVALAAGGIGAQLASDIAARQIDIGRSWPIWPSRSRITVGSVSDMKAFCAATDSIMV